MKKEKNLRLPAIEKINNRLIILLLIIVSAYVCIGISTILFIVYYGVPMGDDYLAIKTYSNPSTWIGEAWHSLITTSRYLQSVTSSVMYGLLGNRVAILLPLLVIAWLFFMIYLYASLGLSKLNLKIEHWKIYGFSAAALVLLVTAGQVAVTSNILFAYQVFFFSSAIVTYTLCVLVFLSLFYVYLRWPEKINKHPKTAFVTFVSVAFLASLFNETVPASLLSISIALLVFSYLKIPFLRGLRKIRPYIFGLSGATLFALIVMYLSPARAARSSFTGGLQSTNIVQPVLTKVSEVLAVYLTPTTILFALFLGVVTTLGLSRISKRSSEIGLFRSTLTLGVVLFMAGILSLFVAITLLVLGYGPFTSVFPRTLFLVQVLIVIGFLLIAVGLLGLANFKLPNKLGEYVVLCTLLITIIATTLLAPAYIKKTSAALSTTEHYHTLWTQQDSLLRNAAIQDSKKTVYLQDDGAGIGDGFSVSCSGPYSKYTLWLTDAMESYYGLREICAQSDLKHE